MTDRDSPPPKPDARTERERRLADALRANLKRRKEQSRGRAEDAGTKKSEQEPGSRGDSD
ncbi:MAG: hypothetical protein JNM29_18790 [Candidatus Odyssella sp.]|nr:hypothetical protein [Candidatus Odyssella sp.]